VVTHLTTNPPVRCLNRAERTGSLVFNVLWSYVKTFFRFEIYNLDTISETREVKVECGTFTSSELHNVLPFGTEYLGWRRLFSLQVSRPSVYQYCEWNSEAGPRIKEL
jgi:hypothetical protein